MQQKLNKIVIYSPNDKEIINKIIDAASRGGAGQIGNYSHCAVVINGYTTWYPH